VIDFQSIFNPGAVAVIGASSRFGKWGQLILSNILAGHFPGKVFPVNPKQKEIYGLPSYASVLDIPGGVDVAFVTTPAETVPAVLDQCARKGIKGVVLITSGFSETDSQGKALEERITALCRESGLILIGPNTMGIMRPDASLFATGIHSRPRKGTVAFISQSGNLGNQLIHWAEQQGIGISLFVGSGNEALTRCNDYLEYLEEDPLTRVIVLYLESVGDGRRFLEVAGRVNRKKPIIVLKGGRTEAGRTAAASHTGSMSGETALFRSACRQAGLLETSVPSELLALSAGFSSLPLLRGNRIGIVTLGGGWGVVTSDECNEKGLAVPALPDHVIQAIDRHLPPFWSKGNPVDLVGTRDPAAPVIAVEELLKWEGVDAVINLGIVGRHELLRQLLESAREIEKGSFSESLAELEEKSWRYEEEYIARMVELMETYGKPVIGVSLTESGKGTVRPVPGKRYDGVFYRSPEDAVNVLAAMAKYRGFLSDFE
jgi:acyl-CoA synthetase (NDP forming)